MSEPTTSVDIEDVLTSIRRLVSEEAHDAVLDQVKPQRSADRLVLTPALRIAEPETPAETAEEATVEEQEAVEVQNEEVSEDAPLMLNHGPSDSLPIDRKISSLSAAVSRGEEEFEAEEGDMFGGISKMPLPWAESHPNDPLSGHDDGSEAIDDEFEDDTIEDQDNTAGALVGLNEDVLRKMVAQIVREELQGEMGERITRNVRKLIRREINRALAIQDLA